MASALELGLGHALLAARRARRLPLREVAAATGISASFISLVEKNKSDITIGRLTRLLDYYDVSLADLLPARRSDDAGIVRADEQRRIPSPSERIDFLLLAPDSDRTMMPMVVAFEPGARLAEPGRHPGEEFVHVLEGTLMLELDGAEHVLEAGDSAYYRAERPHLFQNASREQPLRIVCVDSPPHI